MPDSWPITPTCGPTAVEAGTVSSPRGIVLGVHISLHEAMGATRATFHAWRTVLTVDEIDQRPSVFSRLGHPEVGRVLRRHPRPPALLPPAPPDRPHRLGNQP